MLTSVLQNPKHRMVCCAIGYAFKQMKKTKANRIRANEPLSQCLYGLMKKTRNYFQDSLEPSVSTSSKVRSLAPLMDEKDNTGVVDFNSNMDSEGHQSTCSNLGSLSICPKRLFENPASCPTLVGFKSRTVSILDAIGGSPMGLSDTSLCTFLSGPLYSAGMPSPLRSYLTGLKQSLQAPVLPGFTDLGKFCFDAKLVVHVSSSLPPQMPFKSMTIERPLCFPLDGDRNEYQKTTGSQSTAIALLPPKTCW